MYPRLKKLLSGVQLSERLASLGIMGAQLTAPLKLFEHYITIVSRGSNGFPIMPRDARLSGHQM